MFMSQFQNGWKWNPRRLDWSTDEDKIDVKRIVNPRLRPHSVGDILRYAPEQFKRLNLNNEDDLKFICAVCSDPIKAIALHNRLNTTSKWGHKKDHSDEISTPFQLLNFPVCKDSLLRCLQMSQSGEDREAILQAKVGHNSRCTPCNKTDRNGMTKIEKLNEK